MTFPTLHRLATKYLSIPATSTSVWSFKIMAKVMMTNLTIFVAAGYTLIVSFKQFLKTILFSLY